ncbi:MAG: hypothetical protein K2X29_02395 [Candidatus Obscuribacterales bacterium]|nr:hypothetical protein [Candidatus Obscuribacterales bacterium]
MIQYKRLLAAGALAGVFGLTLLATSSFASGPLVLGPARAPATAPRVLVAPNTHLIKTQLLNSYRQMRTFWLSRAIVR